jgi:hypothetical protein
MCLITPVIGHALVLNSVPVIHKGSLITNNVLSLVNKISNKN